MTAQVIEDRDRRTEAGDPEFELAVDTFKLLGDVTRLKILWALLHGERSVGELADHVGARVPAVSQQLAKLRAARLVRARRDGNHMYYGADDAHVLHLVEQALFHSDHVVRETSARPDRRGVARTATGRRR